MGNNLAYTFVAYNAQNQRYMIIPIVKGIRIFINTSAPAYVYFAASDDNQWSVACPSAEEAAKLLRTAVLIQAHTHIHGNKDGTEIFHIPLCKSDAEALKPGYKAGITYRAWEFTVGVSDLPHDAVEESPLKESNSLAKIIVGLKKSSPVAGLEKALEGLSKNGRYMCFVPPTLNIGDNALTTISSASWICIELEIKRTKSGVLPTNTTTNTPSASMNAPSTTTTSESSGDFIASTKWIGEKPEYEFRQGDLGIGYYRNKKIVTKNETSEPTTPPSPPPPTTTTRPRRRSSGRKPKFGISVLPMPGMTDTTSSGKKSEASAQEERKEQPKDNNVSSNNVEHQIVTYEKTPEKKKKKEETLQRQQQQQQQVLSHNRTNTTMSSSMRMTTTDVHYLQMTCQAIDRQLSTVARDVVTILEAQRQSTRQSQSQQGMSYNRGIDRGGYPYGKNHVSSEALLDGLNDVMTQNKDLREKVKKQEEKIDALESKERQLQADLMVKMNESSKMLRESLEASQKLLDMQQKIGPLTSELETMKKDSESLREENRVLKSNNNSGNNEEISKLKNELSEATKRADETQSSLIESQAVAEKLRSEIATLQSNMSTLQSEIAELQSSRDDLAKRLATSTESVEEEEKKKKEESQEDDEKVSKLQEQIERLKNDLKHAEEKSRVEANAAVQKAIKSAMTQVYTQLQGPFEKIAKGDDEFKLKAVMQIPKMVAKIIRKVTKKVTEVHSIPDPHPPPPKNE